MTRRLAILAGVVILVPLAFVVLTSLLMWSTVAGLVRATARATQWSPR